MTQRRQYIGFPRGAGPLVTVLLPTRGRPKELFDSVESLYNLAINKDKIEFLFRVDTDDLPSIDVCNKLTESLPNARMVVDRRGQGYADMHH